MLKLTQRNNQLEAEDGECQHQLGDLRAKCDVLQQQHDELAVGMIAVDEHINALAALKQYVVTKCFVVIR